MNNVFRYTLAGLCLLTSPGFAQERAAARMQTIMEAVSKGKAAEMPSDVEQGIESAGRASAAMESPDRVDARTAAGAMKQSVEIQKLAREAYVAALPPRDQERGRRMLLQDGSLPGDEGVLYFFVSRSMPNSLLRAYALDAMTLGATLVVKGVRRGETLKEYTEELAEEANTADGQLLAGLEINPTLFDIFQVNVVPTVVWTNRIGLGEAGSGCETPPEGAREQITFPGPYNTAVTLDAPTCVPAPASTFYKFAGALAMPYVVDRFQEAGAPKLAMQRYRNRLAHQHADTSSAAPSENVGNAHPVLEDINLATPPIGLLEHWAEQLSTHNVQRSAYGPLFTKDGEDDGAYRTELLEKIKIGRGG